MISGAYQFIAIWAFVPPTIVTYLRGIREIWWTVIAKGGGYLFFCIGRYPLIRRFDQPGFHGLSRTLARIIVRGREGPPKDMNFHSHRIILSIKGHEEDKEGRREFSFQRDLRSSRSFCADELASSVPVTKIRCPELKSLSRRKG